MAPSTLRKAIGAVKDKTTIGLARVGASASLSDLDVAIVKATRHEEYPAEERYIREIISFTCYSRSYISACVNTLSRRLNKTRNWTVALKTLVLIQRLLSEGDPAYEQEIFFSTRRGTRILNMSDFRDGSQSNSWDYSAFVRTYALYLDERLEFGMQSRREKRSMFGCTDEEYAQEDDAAMVTGLPEEEEEGNYNKNNINSNNNNNNNNQLAVAGRSTPVRDMKMEQIFSRVQHLQQLLERFLACRPTGEAKTHRVVIVALYPIVKESFQTYHDIKEILGILVDRFMDLEIPDCVKIYDIFVRVGKQFDELDMFYGWSKTMGIARSSEYPYVEQITHKKLELMEEFIRDKSALAQGHRSPTSKPQKTEPEPEENKEEEDDSGQDMNSIKALPAPETEPDQNEEDGKEEEKVDVKPELESKEADLLNLGEDALTNTIEQGDRFALALFDGNGGVRTDSNNDMQIQPWQAFDESNTNGDWETALVETASHLSNQKPTLGGGFDTLLLDGMYQQAAANAAVVGPGFGTSGSASSVALGSAGKPAMLALQAPPTAAPSAEGSSLSGMSMDPFSASLSVPPPAYVQMSELEKKQRLLVEEQMMWQQYARDSRLGISNLHRTAPYNMHENYPRS